MNKRIIAVLLMIICLGSIAGGVYSTVEAVGYKQNYTSKMKSHETYSKLAETSNQSKFNLTFFSEQMKDKAAEFKEQADLAKSQLVKFSVLSGVLYFVAVMMLISFVVTLQRIKKEPKKIKEPKARKKIKIQIKTDVEEN